MTKLNNALEKIEKARLASDPKRIVKLVGVSKYSSAAQVKELYLQGQRAFGENKVQDLQNKSETLCGLPLEWHFIGTLQTNKINALLKLNPALIQSIDSYKTANEIAKRTSGKINALLQINSANEDTKSGVSTFEAKDIYARIRSELPQINLVGVMSIGAHTDDLRIVQKSFEATHKIFEELSCFSPKHCSMGMSSDFELAIKCGSNMLRLGSVLF